LEPSQRPPGDRLLRPIQVQQLYGVAASTLWAWAATGKINVAQQTIGGHRRYRESEVRALLAELAAAAHPTAKAVAW
jgi:predicted site-specific integrase-resolvase